MLTLFIFIIGVLVSIFFIYKNKNIKNDYSLITNNHWWLVFAVIILAIGVWLRFVDLGEKNFQNDEYYHLNTAVGFIKTGDYYQWNFYLDKPDALYPRAKPFTWLVAQSFNVFGISEWSARLPAAIFSILFLILSYYIVYHISKRNHLFSCLVLWLITFNDYFISSARICRMYSMFIFCTLLAVYLFYLGIDNFTKKEFFKNKNSFLYIAISLIIIIFNYYIHQAGALLLVGILFYVFILICIYCLKNFKERKKYLLFIFILIVPIISVLFIHFFIIPIRIFSQFITIRNNPHWSYLFYSFSDFKMPLIGLAFFIIGLFSSKYINKKFLYYIICLILPILIYFIFFSDRYSEKRYLSFIIIFFLIICLNGFYQLFNYIFSYLKFKVQYFVISLIVICLFFYPYFSLPLIGDTFLTKKFPQKEDYQNYKIAYQYVIDRIQPGEVLLMQDPRYYYLGKQDIPVFKLGYYKSLKYTNFIELINNNPQGWIIWAKKKENHLAKPIIKYINNNFDYVEELKDTNIIIYHYSN